MAPVSRSQFISGPLLWSVVAHISLPSRQSPAIFRHTISANCPALELMRRLVQQKASCATLRIAVLACSIGAEVYSILWTLRQARPDLNIVLSAVDISKEMLDFAEKGVYGPSSSELVGAPIFERLTAHDKRQMFDWEGDQATVKSWLRKGMAWRLADATDPELSRALGMQDIVVANNFLCHMAPADAEKCLRNIVQLVAPGRIPFYFRSGSGHSNKGCS